MGGGTGIIAEYICPDVKQIVVLDPSEGMLSKIQSTNIEKKQGIAQKIPFKTNTFEVVYCVDSFHHFTNDCKKDEYEKTIDTCIHELLRVLKKEGVLCIIEFDTSNFKGEVIQFFENTLFRWGSRFYSQQEFKELFEQYHVAVEFKQINNEFLAKITKK